MKTVLMTGATGFVGANLARRLLAEGHRLHLLVRPEYQHWRIAEIQADLQLHTVDLRDAGQLQQVVGRIQPEWVFHLATSGAYAWQSEVQQIVNTNVNGTVNLVEACRRTGCDVFVNTGSSSEYGRKDHPPREDERLDPNSVYAVTKAFASHFCRFMGASQNLNIQTLRLYSVYGPFEAPKRFVPTLLLHGLRGRLPPLVDPRTARDFIYVDDVVQAYLSVANASGLEPGSIFNLGTGTQTTIGEAVEIARRVMDIEDRPDWGSYRNRDWDTDIWVANIERIRSVLGWSPRFDFSAGLKNTLEWLDANPGYVEHYLRSGSYSDVRPET